MPGATEEDLVVQLKKEYSRIHNALVGLEDRPLAAVFSTDREVSYVLRGQADAVLFGHVADALCNPLLAPVVASFSSLMTFYMHVCDEYFRVPYVSVSATDDQTWKVCIVMSL